MPNIYMGCSSKLGQGGLGKHLDFVYQTAKLYANNVRVFCRQASHTSDLIDVKEPMWSPWIPYTPVRWLPSMNVYMNGIQFDKHVDSMLPDEPVIYHCFPGYAEHTFQKVRKNGGITVLEAATTHVLDLYSSVSAEHKKFRFQGSPFSRQWVNKVLREYEQADYITVASTLQRESFISNGISESKLLFAPLGVETRLFSPVHNQNSYKPRGKNEKFRIIQLGQVSLLKGFHYLLDAVESLRDPDIELILYGGIGWRSIKTLIDSYKKRGVRIKLGAGDPLPALRNAHLCVHSSINDGFGYAPLEAMAVGLPTIVTDTTGMKDVISNGVNGFIVPAKDPVALARYIAELKSNEKYCLKMGRAARQAALDYDIIPCTHNYASVLRPVCEQLG